MVDKKTKGVLVKVSNLGKDELDKTMDRALDALFGPSDEEPEKEIKPAVKERSVKKTKAIKPTKPDSEK